MKWLKRWRKIGYRKLWYLHYGGYHEGDKGCEREYKFIVEAMSGWHHAFDSERSLRAEAEKLLSDYGIELPSQKRGRELKERFNERK